jgi:hypothetical protein
MQKIDASKLIDILNKTEDKKKLYFVLSDNPIFQKVIHNKLEPIKGNKVYAGKNSVEEYVNYLATCGMFEPAHECIIELPEKLTVKTWSELKNILIRIPNPPEVTAYFFGRMNLKSSIKTEELPKESNCYFAYEPSDIDLPKCAHSLLLLYPFLLAKSKNEQIEIVRLALESYSGDLISCDMHFARMEKGKLDFKSALAGSPEINGFHVAEAIALNDKHLVELRITQCANCGEDASSIFMAIVYFLKQVAFVQSALPQTKNIKLAFEKAKIPYPAQARIQKALSHLTDEKILHFFTAAAHIEMEMRLQKNPHRYLAIELINWLN